MDHYSAAESELTNIFVDHNGNPVRHTAALTHAILALVDKLDEIPILSLCMDSGDEECDDD